jgi:hypothetical protein
VALDSGIEATVMVSMGLKERQQPTKQSASENVHMGADSRQKSTSRRGVVCQDRWLDFPASSATINRIKR